MANTIQIKRSTTTATPTGLAAGELAYSELSDKLFIGVSTGDPADAIGGKSYTDKLDGIEAGAEVNDVNSVNSQTGAVVLDADDIAPTAARIWFTTAEQTKLAGIATGATVGADWDTNLSNIPAQPSGGEIAAGTDTNERIWSVADVKSMVDTHAPASDVNSVFGRTGAVVALAGDYEASEVTNVAAGNLVATTVQAAINELDTEKLAKAGDTMTGDLNMGSNNITGLADGVNAQDAVTKSQLDAVSAGLDRKESVQYATTAALPTVTFTSGGGVQGEGSTLTATANGVLTIDGYAIQPADVGMRLLIKDQANAVHNGIYTVTTVGTVSVPFVLTRATDFDGNPSGEVSGGSHTFVINGTANDKSGWAIYDVTGNVVVDTDAINFTQFQGLPEYTWGDGLASAGDTINVDLATTPGLEFNSNQLRVKIKAASGLVRDADGLSVNLGDFTTADLAETTDARYMSDAQETKLDGITAGAEPNYAIVSQVDAEAGTSTTPYSYTPQRVTQQIAQASLDGGTF